MTRLLAKLGLAQIGIAHDGSMAIATRFGKTETFAPGRAPKWIRRKAKSGEFCAAATSGKTGLTIQLDPPKIGEKKLRGLLGGLLEVKLPFPIAQCNSGFSACEGNTYGIAARRTDIEKTIAELNERGLDPERIVPCELPVWSYCLRALPAASDDARRVIILAGADSALLICGAGRRMKSSAISPLDSDSLRRCAQMSVGRISPGIVCIVAGPGAVKAAKFVSSWLHEDPIEPVLPEKYAQMEAAALAEDALADRHDRANLRTGEFAHPHGERAMNAAACWLVAATVLCLGALTAFAAASASSAEQFSATFRRELSASLATVAGYKIRSASSRAVDEAKEALEGRLSPFVGRAMNRDVDAKLIKLMALAKESGVGVTHVALSDGSMNVSGTAASGASARAFDAALQPIFGRTRLEFASAPNGGQDAQTSFFVTAEAAK